MKAWTLNPVTNQYETTFTAKVVSIGETIVENSNGTKYNIGVIELPNGKEVSARVLAQHTPKIEVGKEFVINCTKYERNGQTEVDLRISPLTTAARATADDMGFLGDEVADEAPVATAKVGAVEMV